MTTELAATSSSVGPDVVQRYRENGFVHVPQVLSPEEVTVYREAAREAYETRTAYNGEDDRTFKQILQLWKTERRCGSSPFTLAWQPSPPNSPAYRCACGMTSC